MIAFHRQLMWTKKFHKTCFSTSKQPRISFFHLIGAKLYNVLKYKSLKYKNCLRESRYSFTLLDLFQSIHTRKIL